MQLKRADQRETRPIAISCVLLANSDQQMDQWTDQPTNGQTNKAAHRVACMQLKISWFDHVCQGDYFPEVGNKIDAWFLSKQGPIAISPSNQRQTDQ